MRSKKANDSRYRFLFVFPAVLYIVVTIIIPLIFAVILSFQSGHGKELSFSGLENLVRLFNDTVFRTCLKNTLVFVLLITPPTLLICLFLLFLLFKTRSKQLTRFFSTIFYLPSITSPVVYSLFFKQISYSDGILSKMLNTLNVVSSDYSILRHVTSARIYIAIICVWSWTGFFILLLNSSMQSINEETINAARMDGAYDTKIFFRIVIPFVSPSFLMIVILVICSSLQIYVEPALITKGGPGVSTQTLSLYLYRKMFTYVTDYGYSSLVGVSVFAISFLLTIMILLVRRNENKK